MQVTVKFHNMARKTYVNIFNKLDKIYFLQKCKIHLQIILYNIKIC